MKKNEGILNDRIEEKEFLTKFFDYMSEAILTKNPITVNEKMNFFEIIDAFENRLKVLDVEIKELEQYMKDQENEN